MNANRLPPLALLASAIVAALATTSSAYAAIIMADNAMCTLDKAITSANTDSPVTGCVTGFGADTIQIITPLILTTELPAVVSDIAFVGSVNSPPTITGDGTHRLFLIGAVGHSPIVSFTNLVLIDGVAQGGNSTAGTNAGGGAGGGAGLGGALFIYDGTVSVSRVSFNSNSATGGAALGVVAFGASGNVNGSGSGGGGGMFGTGGTGGDNYSSGTGGGSGGFGGGGGGGGDTSSSEFGGSNGGAGGGGVFGGSGGLVGSSGPGAGEFGGGGGGGAGSNSSVVPSQSGAAGGFGGGGGGGAGAGGTFVSSVPGAAGAGGFGGGGGAGGSTGFTQTTGGIGGAGGFGGGGGTSGSGSTFVSPGAPGYGGGGSTEGGGGGGAGFGGAIFIRSGQLDLAHTQFNSNSSAHGSSLGSGGSGKGGALFALNILTNPNGNDQGMPAALPTVTGCGNAFTGSTAGNAGGTDLDNADTFGASRVDVTKLCDLIFADGFGTP